MTPTPIETVIVKQGAAGDATDAKPTFLERWGVRFVAWTGGWILAVCIVLLAYYLWKLPQPPSVGGLSADQAGQQLREYADQVGRWRDSLSYVFDLLVTKTVLPIVTLLLGYLFGKTKS